MRATPVSSSDWRLGLFITSAKHLRNPVPQSKAQVAPVCKLDDIQASRGFNIILRERRTAALDPWV